MELLHEKTFPPDSTEAKVVAVLKTCYDPEIPVDIFALGLIYDVEVSDSQDVHVTMTLTSPRLSGRRHPAAGNRAQNQGPCPGHCHGLGRGRVGSAVDD